MAKADIELLFGVLGGGDISKGSGKEIKDALDSIINQINQHPLEVKVQLNQTNVSEFKKELESLTTYAEAEAAKIQAAYGNIKFPQAPTGPSGGGSGGAGGSGGSGSGGGGGSKKKTTPHDLIGTTGTDYLKALTELQKAQTEIEKLIQKWSGLKDEIGNAAISRIKDEGTNLKAYETALRNGTMYADDLERNMIEATAVIKQAGAELALLGTKTKEVDFTVGSERHTKAIAQVNKLLEQTIDKVNTWSAASRGATAGEFEFLKASTDGLKGLLDELKSGSISLDEFKKKFSGFKDGIENASRSIRIAGKDTKSWGDRIGALAKKFSEWFGVSQVIMRVVRTSREMLDTVIKLDTAMTELRKVTNESESTYIRFLENAEVRAKKLGATLTDTVNATADFARLGYGIDDASTLADVAIMYKNIGDGIEDISTASESLISTMQAFTDLTINDAQSIIDKFNEVGNTEAITSAGIGDALQRSAAAMSAAGNSLDETIALIAAAILYGRLCSNVQ